MLPARVLCLVVVLGVAANGSAQQRAATIAAPDLYKMASPSVVLIEIYGEDHKVSGNGSGFIISADGIILTNYHVIAHTKGATVRLANGDAYDDVSVLDIDKRKDVAVIKIKAVGLPPLKLGHSGTVQVGDTLYALGNPLGEDFQNTLSEGILSGIRQGDGYRLFQLSTPISHGSSGSPVFDTQGNVVGIVEGAVEEGQSINFAIPIDYAAGMLGSTTPRSLESIYEPPESTAPSKSAGSQPAAVVSANPSDALKSDALDYLAQKVGVWTKHDADKEFGQPYTRRDATFNSAVLGDVYKYKSPAAEFNDIELNFDGKSGRLVAAYCYPQGIVAWMTIRGRLGNHYSRQKGPNGTHFYTYQILQHQLHVYVDSIENVISLGVW